MNIVGTYFKQQGSNLPIAEQITQHIIGPIAIPLTRADLPDKDKRLETLIAFIDDQYRQRHGHVGRWSGAALAWDNDDHAYYLTTQDGHRELFGRKRRTLEDHLIDYVNTGRDNAAARRDGLKQKKPQ